MSVIAITDANFQSEVMQSDVPVLIDFYADWCQPCKRIAPIMVELADEYEGVLKVVKVNTEQARRAAGQFAVRSIPTVALVNKGQVVEKSVGAKRKDFYVKLVEQVVTKPAPTAKVEQWPVVRLKSAAEIDMAIAVDARDQAAYDASHIAGAIHMGAADRAARIGGLKVDDFVTYVVYGPDAKATADALLAAGHHAAVLVGGFAAWKAEHLPVT